MFTGKTSKRFPRLKNVPGSSAVSTRRYPEAMRNSVASSIVRGADGDTEESVSVNRSVRVIKFSFERVNWVNEERDPIKIRGDFLFSRDVSAQRALRRRKRVWIEGKTLE